MDPKKSGDPKSSLTFTILPAKVLVDDASKFANAMEFFGFESILYVAISLSLEKIEAIELSPSNVEALDVVVEEDLGIESEAFWRGLKTTLNNEAISEKATSVTTEKSDF